MNTKASYRASAGMLALFFLPLTVISQPLFNIQLRTAACVIDEPIDSWDAALAATEKCFIQSKAANFAFCQGRVATPLHYADLAGPNTNSDKHITSFSLLAESPTGHCSERVVMSFCEPGYVWNDARSLCVASVTKPEKNLGPGTLCAGNPINVGTGNKYQRERDYEGAGAYPLRLERHYNSSGVVQSGALGANWRHHYERSLTRIGDIVWVYRHNGKQLRFTRGTDGLWHGEPDVTLRLSETTDVSGAQDGWAIDSADDEHETYDLGLGDSRLTSIRNRAGHTHTLTYRQGRLDTVADGFGRTLTFEYTSNGLNVTDPGNNVFAYRQDSEKRLETVRYPDDTADDSDNPTKLYLYEDPSFLKALTGLVNENGKRFATWSYDSAGRAVSSEHAGAVERTTIAYNPDGSRTVTDASNTQHVTFEPKHGVLLANSTDQPCSASNAQFASTAYDANGFLTRRTDFNNYVTNYIFNDRGLEESRTEAFGTPEARTITTVWNPTWRKPDTIMRDGQVIAFTYDAAGRLLTRTETDTATLKSRTVTRTYNTLGLLETIDGPRVDVSDVTTLVYYPNGDRHTSTNALGHVTTFNLYDAHGRVTKMTDPNGLVTEFAYDVHGRLIERRVDSLVTRFGYDLAGNLTRLTSPDNSVLSYEYDAANRLTDIVDALGNRITYTLDAVGNRVKEDVFLPDGVTLVRTQSMEYDKMRRVKKRRSGVGQTQEFEYDDVGNLLVTIDGKLQRTVRMPDPLRRVSSITDAASSITQFAYDARDNLLVVTDPRGLATQYEHDGLDDLIQLISPDTGLTSYVNDEAGNRTASTDARGVNVATAYDALNRVTTVIYPDASLNITNTYDSAPNGVGRLARVTDASGQTQFVYDLRGNVVQQTRAMAGASYVVDYAYDSMDRVSRIAYPSGASVGYLRDTLGQVNQVELTHEGTTQVLASAIGYEPFGAAKDIVLGNALPISRNFDLAGRLTSIDTVGVLERDYVFDANDNITLIDDIHNPAATQTFDYDALNRVTAAEGVYGALTYAYDALGNRTRRGAPEGSDTYRYDAFSNRLQEVAGSNAQNFGYDAAGNIVTRGARTYDYDDSGRLAVALNAGQVQATYGYNANGERSLKATALEQTHFVFASDGLLLMEAVKGVGVTRESVYLNGQLLAVVTPGAGGGDGLLNFADTTASVQVDEVARTVKLTLADGREFAVTVAAANWSETEDDSVRLIRFTGVTPAPSALAWLDGSLTFVDGVSTAATVSLRLPPPRDGYYSMRAPLRANEYTYTGIYARTGGTATLQVNEATRTVSIDEQGFPSATYTIAAADWNVSTAGGYDIITFHHEVGTLRINGQTKRNPNRHLAWLRIADGDTTFKTYSLLSAPMTGGTPVVRYAHLDHLGTPQAFTDDSGQVAWRGDYLPFGQVNETVNDVEQPVRFPGQFEDEAVGGYYNYQRYYDPSIGRYITSDPIGLDGGINTYAYANNNSLRYIDPTGENPAIPIVAIACLSNPACVGAIGISLTCLANPSTCEDMLGSICDAGSAASDTLGDLLKPLLNQDKKLTPGEIKKLKGKGIDPEELKGGKATGQRDLFKDKKGNIVVKPKDGRGPGDPTGININDL